MIVVERERERYELKNVSISTEGKKRRVLFHGDGASLFFELEKSKLGGYSKGLVKMEVGDKKVEKILGRLELETIRRRLMEGETHHLALGGVSVRIGPEALGYLFPRDTYTLFTRLLMRAWELSKKIKELKR